VKGRKNGGCRFINWQPLFFIYKQLEIIFWTDDKIGLDWCKIIIRRDKVKKSLVVMMMLMGITVANAQEGGVYELRTYLTNDGKLDDLHARFRGYTMALFDKHGMEHVGYWVPVDTPNTLIYIIKHKSIDAAKQSWKNFIDDPDWKVVAEESNRDGAILAKAPDSVFMSETDYSPLSK
tara:strand:+ start:93091 stop:93624 length:534 start_codon:yes stop_codon:yes gene_type:complete